MDEITFLIFILIILSGGVGGIFYYFYVYTDKGLSFIDGNEDEDDSKEDSNYSIVKLYDSAAGNWIYPIYNSCQSPTKEDCAHKCSRAGWSNFTWNDTEAICKCVTDSNWASEDTSYTMYSLVGTDPSISDGLKCDGSCILFHGEKDHEIHSGYCDLPIENDKKCYKKHATDDYEYLFDNCCRQDTNTSFYQESHGDQTLVQCQNLCNAEDTCIAIEVNNCNKKVYFDTRDELIEAIRNWFSSNKDVVTYGDIREWDVSKITDMTGLFNPYYYMRCGIVSFLCS